MYIDLVSAKYYSQPRCFFRIAGDGQRGYVEFSPYHWFRFWGVGRMSLVARMIQLDRNASISHKSFQEIFHLLMPSQRIHCPCFPCATARAKRAACPCPANENLLCWSCFVQNQRCLSKSKASSSLIHTTYDVLELVDWFGPKYSCCQGPFPRCCQLGGSFSSTWVAGICQHHLQVYFGNHVLL